MEELFVVLGAIRTGSLRPPNVIGSNGTWVRWPVRSSTSANPQSIAGGVIKQLFGPGDVGKRQPVLLEGTGQLFGRVRPSE